MSISDAKSDTTDDTTRDTANADLSLRAHDLTLCYGAKKHPVAVIEKVNLSLFPGQVLVIQGPNGSGKSTLMKGLARQLKASAGKVTLASEEIWQMKIGEFAKKVAYVPQNLETPTEMTVHELVALGRNPHQRWWSTELNESESAVVSAAISRCGLSNMSERRVSELSGGEKQRATIATALAQEPQFILMDEPTASLDFRYQLELIAIIKELKNHNIGIALILHDLNLCARIADQVALVGRNKNDKNQPSLVVAQGTVQEVLQTDQLRSVFGVDLTIVKDSESHCDVYIPRAISLEN